MSIFASYITYALTYAVSISILLLYQKTDLIAIKFGSLQCNLRCIQKILIVLACIPVLLLSSFRYGIGTDFQSFYKEYQWCVTNVSSYDKLLQASVGFNDEIGLILLMKIGGEIFDSFQGFLFLSSLLTVVPILVSFIIFDKKNVAFCFLIYLLTLFPSSFNGIHQHIAVSWSLLAIVFAYREKFKQSIVMILIAILFHKTALVTIAFLVCLKISRKHPTLKLSYIVLIAFLSLIGYQYFVQILQQVPVLSRYAYAFNENYKYSINYLIMHTVLKLPLLFITLLFYKSILKSDRKNMALVCYTIIDFLGVFLAFYVRWAMRLQYYTLVVAPLLLVTILKRLNKQSNKPMAFMIRLLMIISYSIRFVILFGIYGYDEIMPYSYIAEFMR